MSDRSPRALQQAASGDSLGPTDVDTSLPKSPPMCKLPQQHACHTLHTGASSRAASRSSWARHARPITLHTRQVHRQSHPRSESLQPHNTLHHSIGSATPGPHLSPGSTRIRDSASTRVGNAPATSPRRCSGSDAALMRWVACRPKSLRSQTCMGGGWVQSWMTTQVQETYMMRKGPWPLSIPRPSVAPLPAVVERFQQSTDVQNMLTAGWPEAATTGAVVDRTYRPWKPSPAQPQRQGCPGAGMWVRG